jgi:hypothetical protein
MSFTYAPRDLSVEIPSIEVILFGYLTLPIPLWYLSSANNRN